MSGSSQRAIRQAVVEALYESETSDHDTARALDRRLEFGAEEVAELGEGKFQRRAHRMLEGVLQSQDEADEYIQRAAPQYPLDTMAIIDRNILRLAIWELLADSTAPVAAVVNEAVELARRYGGDTSPSFVNGVLRTVSEQIAASRSATEQRPGRESESN